MAPLPPSLSALSSLNVAGQGAFHAGSYSAAACYVQGGTTALSFSSGAATLTFPHAFAYGLVALQLTPVVASAEAIELAIETGTASLSGASVLGYVSGAAASGSITVSWLAFGC